jgi:hypothetical protein
MPFYSMAENSEKTGETGPHVGPPPAFSMAF